MKSQKNQKMRKRAEEIVKKLTLDEKAGMIHGAQLFQTAGVERLGIPPLKMSDGPMGVRQEFYPSSWKAVGNSDDYVTYLPCNSALASTWNRELAYAYGKSLGTDARARGVHIMLGPGVNIYRFPKCGRNFEYYGEDPYLTSETAVQYIKGMQSVGVMSTIKHFCGNNQEYNRNNGSSDMDERTLNEIYLPAFRKAVQVAETGAVMSSYNLVNSVHMTENKALIKDMLRD